MNLRSNRPAARRRGVILLVVLAMLTLFAIAGITFVLYANAASESARVSRDAESYTTSFPDMDPTTSFNIFLSQFVYGVNDNDTQLVESSLRGQSLAETMYGSWDALGNVPSDVPFDGTGRLNEGTLYPGISDSTNLVNYTWFKTTDPTFLRDPGCLGSRTSQAAARGTYTGGQNPPYTYPDLNNMFLATLNATTGQITQQSYYRSRTGIGALNPSTNPATNTNWYSPSGLKYATLRPRPAEYGNTFPPPATATGDVQNFPGTNGNDSIWMDIGAPTLTTAAGLRYKMLVAPLILDLDNRINLNVVGNILASTGGVTGHASNQGWGPWEINMNPVLPKPNVSGTGQEWPNLFVGNPNNGAKGRYGPNGNPDWTFALAGTVPHVYAQADLNGTLDPAPNTVTGSPYTLPTAGNGYFPSFPGGYGNGAASETQNGAGVLIHPMFFNPFSTSADDVLFSVSDHAALMWAGVNASPNSNLVKLSPTNFSATDNTTLTRIHQTTTLSMDLDRPGAAPYIYDPSTTAYAIAYNVTAPGNGSYTTSTGTPAAGLTTQPTFPTISPRQAAPAQPGEFDTNAATNTWRSTLAQTLSRINLNRSLTPYTGAGGNPAQAATDRQQFAMDIMTRLVNVTGMTPYYTPGTGANPGSLVGTPTAQYPTLRWLAQLSANIVDFIDTDDVMTSFQWVTANPNDSGYVFGTELPKLVVNEVYLEYDNDSKDPTMIPDPNNPGKMKNAAKNPYRMNVWAELLNPLPTGTDPNGANVNNAALWSTANSAPIYQLVITSPNQGIRNAGNNLGDPDASGYMASSPTFASQPYNGTGAGTGQINGSTGGQVLAVVDVSGGGNVGAVTPVGTAQAGQSGPITGGASATGFMVIGPSDPGYQGQPASTQVQMQTALTVTADDATGTGKGMVYTAQTTDSNADSPLPPTILLQRLANPNLKFSNTPGPNYNPWVTVDYVDMQQVGKAAATANKPVVNDARAFNSTGDNPNWTANNNYVQTPTNRFSFGRNEPYGAVETSAEWQPETAGAAASPTAFKQPPTTTFFDVNTAQAGVNPDWLVHLDRPLISPVELLNVSAFKPHELTQQFYKDTVTGNYAHMAPWTTYNAGGTATPAQNFLLYRLLEFVKAGNATPGIVAGGRVPGKININTLDPNGLAVFQALCDAQTGNTFSPADVQTIFSNLMNLRTPGDPANSIPAGTPSSKDQPFWGMAQGPAAGGDAQSTGARGLSQTLLNSVLQNPTLASGASHPYQKMELLNKIFNNLTTRSNTFAVWLTVGFFPITNDQVQPNQLGPEINLANGRNIRHHMFAIVDRTQIVTFGNLNPTGPGAVLTTAPISAPTTAGGTATASISINPSATDPRTGRAWTIQAGTTLVYDPGVYNFNTPGQPPTQPCEETVVVYSNGGVLSANFAYPHNQGANVISRGHPGPMNTNSYLFTNDSYVIPYHIIID